MKLGATGKHPQGKLNKDDEGELTFAVAHDDGNVIINFGTPVAWLAMDPQLTADFAATLLRHAREAARESGKPLTVTIGGV